MIRYVSPHSSPSVLDSQCRAELNELLPSAAHDKVTAQNTTFFLLVQPTKKNSDWPMRRFASLRHFDQNISASFFFFPLQAEIGEKSKLVPCVNQFRRTGGTVLTTASTVQKIKEMSQNDGGEVGTVSAREETSSNYCFVCVSLCFLNWKFGGYWSWN